MQGHVLELKRRVRPLCPELGPDCLELHFCEAWQCAVDLRRGLTGELTHCPLCGVEAVATNRPAPRARRLRGAPQ